MHPLRHDLGGFDELHGKEQAAVFVFDSTIDARLSVPDRIAPLPSL
jgi:hypothetical protein